MLNNEFRWKDFGIGDSAFDLSFKNSIFKNSLLT